MDLLSKVDHRQRNVVKCLEQATIKTYKLRMWIEEMYGDMKGHGFDLEATHMRDLDRLSRLVLGVCLVYAWLISLGNWVIKNGKRPLVDKKARRDKSCFRIGWSWLKRRLSQGQSLKVCTLCTKAIGG
jgi:hypothetical protein